MKNRWGLTLLASLAATSLDASTLPRMARFQRAHHVSQGSTQLDDFQVAGLRIIGERILLENGRLTVSIQKVIAPDATLEGVAASAAVALDDAFFADPIKAVVSSFLAASTATVAHVKAQAQIVDDFIVDNQLVNIELKDVKVTHAQGAYVFTFRFLFLGVEAKGQASYNAQAKEIGYRVDSITAGGFPVNVDLAFFIMSHFMNYEFLRLQKPHVYLKLSYFLPGGGGSAEARASR